MFEIRRRIEAVEGKLFCYFNQQKITRDCSLLQNLLNQYYKQAQVLENQLKAMEVISNLYTYLIILETVKITNALMKSIQKKIMRSYKLKQQSSQTTHNLIIFLQLQRNSNQRNSLI